MLNLFDVQHPLRPDIYPNDNLKPAVINVRNFDENAAERFCQQFQEAIQRRQPLIPIHIDSYGGQVYSLQPMIAMIQHSPVPVVTYVQSKAMSCGAFLAAFGTRGYRYMNPRASMMVHEVSAGTGGKVHDIKVTADDVLRLNNGLFEELALHCGWDKDYFLNQIHQKNHADWFLQPEEAKNHRLIDHVAIPKLVTRVRVETSLETASVKDCF